MNSETIDLIATDPPFNKGRDFHATPESLAAGASFQDRWRWDKDVNQDWIDQLENDWQNVRYVIESARKSWGDGMGAYLCFMAVRLIAMRRLLKPTGSIYLHCDPTASHYLKMLMDSVFGRDMFLNEIIWHYDGPQRPSRKRFGSKHDVIFRYGKSASFYSNEDGIAPFQALSDDDLAQSQYKTLGDGRYYYTTPRGDYTNESIKRLKKEDRVEYTRNNKARIRHFLPIEDGVVGRKKQLPDVWSDIVSLGHAGGRERTNFPTQKPLALYERIIKASSKEGDMVLDPFAGCATTPIAAERLGRQWVGIDIWDKAPEVVIQRMEQEGLIAPKYTRKTKINREQFLFTDEFTFTDELPKRTDEMETDVAYLEPKLEFQKEPWERLSRQNMVHHLAEAQIYEGRVICAGCGRELEVEFMELDHINPRAGGGSNDISNRILLCAPCNKKKRHELTLPGLHKQNKSDGWMADESAAKAAMSRASKRAQEVKKGKIELRLSLAD